MGITHDDFIRTTSARHKRGVQKLFQTLKDNGKIELRSYTGSYCVSDEAFVDLPAGAPCPDCGRPLETVTEQNYFFKLSEYQLPLINLIESNQLAIQPESRRNEVLSFLRGPVSDLQKNSVILSEAQSAQPQHSPEAEKNSVILSEARSAQPQHSSEAEKNSVILSEAQSAQPQHSSESEKKPVILSEARSAQSKDPDEAASASSGGPFPTQTLAYSALGTPYIPGTLKDLSISRTSFEWGIPVPRRRGTRHLRLARRPGQLHDRPRLRQRGRHPLPEILARRPPHRRQGDHPLPLRLLARLPARRWP